MSVHNLMIDGNPVIQIGMQDNTVSCWICGVETEFKWGVPTFNGDLMSNDWPGEWFGQSVCERCFDLHEQGKMITHDNLYRHLLLEQFNGSGI